MVAVEAPVALFINGRAVKLEEVLGADVVAELKVRQQREMAEMVAEDMEQSREEQRKEGKKQKMESVEVRKYEVTEDSAPPRSWGSPRAYVVDRAAAENGGVERRRYLWSHDPASMPPDCYWELENDEELADLPVDMSSMASRAEVADRQRAEWRRKAAAAKDWARELSEADSGED